MEERVVEVALGTRGYKIYIGWGNLSSLGGKLKSVVAPNKAAVITHPVIADLYGERVVGSLREAGFETHLLNVPDGEEYKSLEVASNLYGKLAELEFHRFDCIVVLGGGVVGDLAGFVAATYMRGVPFIQVPTTLLGQVDSGIGGKVAVDHPRAKNLIGCFYQPRLVLNDMSTIKSLPEPEVKSGLAEVIKYGFLRGEEFLSFLEANLDSLLRLERNALIETVVECCRMKAAIVEEDERDLGGRRAILNYGHTVGHALEATTGYTSLLHGEGVAIGMVCAARIAQRLGLIDEALVERHIALLSRAGLPTRLPISDIGSIQERILLDKKSQGEASIFVLLKGLGKPALVEVPPQVIREALEECS
ncbi:MAG TPA: 3-dehydroquinate synthase [Actinobacteria bacterium]|nr:3-dehydroquinate synthase [Actinomycetota bacterium]